MKSQYGYLYEKPSFEEIQVMIPEQLQPMTQFVDEIRFYRRSNYHQEMVSSLELINSEDIVLIHRGLLIYRNQLENAQDDRFLNFKKIIPKLIAIAKMYSIPIFTYHVVCIIRHIEWGHAQQIKYVVENGGLLLLINSLESPYLAIANQAAWAIQHIVRRNQYRKIAIEMNVITNLINLIKRNQRYDYLMTSFTALRYCLKFSFTNKGFNFLTSLINIFFESIKKLEQSNYQFVRPFDKMEKEELLKSFQRELSFVAKQILVSNLQLMDSDFIGYLINLIMDDKLEIQINGFQMLVAIVNADDDCNNKILQKKFFVEILFLLKRGNNFMIQKVFKILQNMINVYKPYLSQILSYKQIIQNFFRELKTQSIYLKEQLFNFLYPIIANVTLPDFNCLIGLGLLELLIQDLEFNSVNDIEGNLISANLIALKTVFEKGIIEQDQLNMYITKLKSINGINIIKQVQNHSNQNIVFKSKMLLRIYILQ